MRHIEIYRIAAHQHVRRISTWPRNQFIGKRADVAVSSEGHRLSGSGDGFEVAPVAQLVVIDVSSLSNLTVTLA